MAMASFNPTEFAREVRREVGKVTWPTRKETTVTSTMVFVMVVLSALFFLLVDQIFAHIVRLFLDLGV